MDQPRTPDPFRLPSWVAAIAFAAVIGCHFLVFFTVRVGDAEPTAVKGIDLALGFGQTAQESATHEAEAVQPVDDADTSTTEPAVKGSVADKARRLLEREQKAQRETPAPIIQHPHVKARAPMAVALLACAILGLAASLIPLRASRFASAALAIIGLICAALLMTGAKDLPVEQLTDGTGVITGAFEALPGTGFWAAIGCLALAALLAALGLSTPSKTGTGSPREKAAHTKSKAVAATPAMRTYSSSEKPDQKPRAPAPVPPEPPAPATLVSPPTTSEIPIASMVPEEPPKGPDTPQPPPSSGWSFKQPDPTQVPSRPRTPEPTQPAQTRPSSWSFGGSDGSGDPQAQPPHTPTPQPPKPTATSWSFGSSGTQPEPAQPPSQPPPPPQPPPSSSYAPPPPHHGDPMDDQGPPFPPSPNRSDNVFLEFARPYFDLIDSGALYRKPFVLLYIILAGLNLLSILGVLGFMFKGGISLIITGLFAIFALWVGFQLWWNRRGKVESFVTPGSEFVALAVVSHLWQTSK
jgi:hypothetical protein